jgi:hypothetical protein
VVIVNQQRHSGEVQSRLNQSRAARGAIPAREREQPINTFPVRTPNHQERHRTAAQLLSENRRVSTDALVTLAAVIAILTLLSPEVRGAFSVHYEGEFAVVLLNLRTSCLASATNWRQLEESPSLRLERDSVGAAITSRDWR